MGWEGDCLVLLAASSLIGAVGSSYDALTHTFRSGVRTSVVELPGDRHPDFALSSLCYWPVASAGCLPKDGHDQTGVEAAGLRF
jgi:hypothetical protein